MFGTDRITSLACEALTKGRVLELRYDGYFRCVEVHAVGVTKDGHGIMRVWQVSGGSLRNEPLGWKLLRSDEVGGATIGKDKSQAPRPGYKTDDSAMQRIICQIY